MIDSTLSEVPQSSTARGTHPLDVFFAPESVAVIGATEAPGSLGRALVSNLIRNPFGGVLFPINTHRHSVLGVKAYRSLAVLPRPVELAVVATPAATVPDILDECRAANVDAAIVLSGGFGESSSAGAAAERQVRQRLRGSSMRVLGLNSFGVACPRTGFNATCAPAMFPRGNVGFLSQSGALLTALLHQQHESGVGCSAAVSVGSLIDIGWAEWLDYLATDPQTACIGIYMEQLDDAQSFFARAREVAATKPIILVKGGRFSVDGRAAPCTSKIDDQVFDEACRCNGVLRVRRGNDLFRVAAHLTAQPVPKGRRLAIVTNARGPAMLAVDALRGDGAALIDLAPGTVTDLSGVLPRWDRQNPIDVSDADAACFTRAAAIAAGDPNTDALLVLLSPQAPMDAVRAAAGVCEVARESGKPVLACWMCGAASPESLEVLRDAGIPTFRSPEAAVSLFGYLWRHAETRRFLGELREALADAGVEPIDKQRAAAGLTEASQGGQTVVGKAEVLELLAVYDLPVQQSREAVDEFEAEQKGADLGYPVVLELAGLDAGGSTIRLEAADGDGVRRAVRTLHLVAREYFGAQTPRVTLQAGLPPTAVEMAVSSTTAEGLGPVIRLGEGGRPTEAPRHSISALAPLTPLTVRAMIEHKSVQAALRSRGGPPIEGDALEQFLLRLSRLVAEQPRIKEITVNPLLVWDGRVLAGNVRILLHDWRMGA